jgi:hypothetical protein
MTTKTPSGLATGEAGSDDETIDDSLDEILLRANEKPSEGALRSPLPKLQLPRPTNTATLLGVLAPSLPLPGAMPPPTDPEEPAVAEPPEITPAVLPRSDEVTQIARSSLLDDEPSEEETKVNPLETARHAAASKDEVEIALTEQASAEREKALRKSFPPAPQLSDPDTGPEFGARAPDRASDTTDTPAALAVGDDMDDESTANGRGPLSGSGGGGLAAPVSLGGGGSRLPLPTSTILGRSEPFSARLPTPGAGFGVPAPSPSFSVSAPSPPLGIPSYGTPALATGYGPPPGASSVYGGTRASSPAVPIPAPLGAPASVHRSAVFNKVQLPVGGLVAFLIAAFSLGLVVGAWRWRGEEAEIPVVVAPPAVAPVIQPAAPPAPGTQPAASAPVVQPVPAPAAEAEPAAAPPQVVPAPPTAAVAVEPTPIPAAPAPPPRPARPRRPPADSSQASGSLATASSTMPKPKAAKKTTAKPQVDSRGVAKGWVDPFAQ